MFRIFFILLLTVVFGLFAQTQPNLRSSCRRNDPDVSVCMKRTIMRWKPYLAEGVPNIGVPRMEPIFFEKLFDKEPMGPNKSVFMTVTNIRIYGCTQYIVRNLDVSVEEGILHYEALFPNIYIDGQYEVSGVNIIPMSGSGQVTTNYSNVVGDINIEWEIVKRKNNKEYIKIKKVTASVQSLTATDVFLEKFLHSSPDVSGILVAIINILIKNSVLFWNIISHDVILAVEKKMSPMMMEVMNSVTSHVPYDDILLDL